MNSLILEKNGCLNYRQTSDPRVKEDECLIHVRSAGICHSDLFRAFESGAYHYPLIMGHEFCGTIEQKGGDAGNFEIGQHVTVFPLIPCFQCEACKQKKWVLCQDYDYYGSGRDGAFAGKLAVKAWCLLPVTSDSDLFALTEPIAVAFHTAKRIKRQKMLLK